MKSDRFREVERIFHAARRVIATERAALLDRECGDDRSLRADVMALLKTHEDTSGAGLHAPALGVGFNLDQDVSATSNIGDQGNGRIGHYRIISLLGMGGMGEVFLAENENTGQRAALKLIRRGVLSPQLLRRFDLEAQVLGRLKHVGIAQIYDADVQDGQPYIAMEYVQGMRLSEWVEREIPSTHERLGLFADICDAVHYAHTNGVIHRDLKPDNVLVTERSGTSREGDRKTGGIRTAVGPIAKIVDFGIARLTDSDIRTTTLKTDRGQLLGTLQYMSPEQATGDPLLLDARSDVYALGVLGYELIAGRAPYDLSNCPIPEAVRIIAEQDAALLSDTNRTLRGDVTTVFVKALDKDPARRYQSAQDLGEDIRRFLANAPILAHPPSALYQMRKFALRHRAFVSAVCIIAIVLLGATITSIVFAVHTERARGVAEQRSEDLHSLTQSLIFEIDTTIENVPGALAARKLLVQKGLEYLSLLRQDAEDDLDLLNEIAVGYIRLGDVQGDPHTSNIGDTNGALHSYTIAWELLELVQEVGSNDRFTALVKIGEVRLAMNEHAAAADTFERALREIHDRASDDIENIDTLRHLLIAHGRLTDTSRSAGDEVRATEHEEHEKQLTERLAKLYPNDRRVQRDLAIASFKSGTRSLMADALDEALHFFEGSITILERLANSADINDIARSDLAAAYERRGQTLHRLKRIDEAAESYKLAVQVGEDLVKDDAQNVYAKASLCSQYCLLGELMLSIDDSNAALTAFERYLELTEEVATADPHVAAYQREFGVALYKMAEWYGAQASDEPLNLAERIETRNMSCQWLKRSVDQFDRMKQAGQLAESDIGVPAMLHAELAECNAQLDELRRAGH